MHLNSVLELKHKTISIIILNFNIGIQTYCVRRILKSLKKWKNIQYKQISAKL